METKEVKIEIPEGYEIDKSKSSAEKIVFKKKENKFPKTYREFLNNYDHSDRTLILVQYKYEEAFLALRKLLELRDVYNDGWKPNWENPCETKYVITTYCNAFTFRYDDCKNVILAFKSDKLRDEFYNNFKDLIEKAKELL